MFLLDLLIHPGRPALGEEKGGIGGKRVAHGVKREKFFI
jgi:hypothetical protein